jgi:hypothetical protein
MNCEIRIPQGLKPDTLARNVFGTAKAVPFQTVDLCRVPKYAGSQELF